MGDGRLRRRFGLSLARPRLPAARPAISEDHIAVQRERFEIALSLSGVGVLAARGVDLG
jgi:hypothetical protein